MEGKLVDVHDKVKEAIVRRYDTRMATLEARVEGLEENVADNRHELHEMADAVGHLGAIVRSRAAERSFT